MRRFALALAVLVAAAVLAAPASAQTPCTPAPAQIAPQFAGTTPKLGDVVKNPGGDGGEVTTEQAYQYMDAVDRASDKVITGSLDQLSQQGRELRYAIVGRSDRLSPTGLQAVRTAAQKLRDPFTTEAEADAIIASNPAILWIASNVHGGEESGTDASLRVLYELADRTDASAQRILDNAVVVLLPIQNPDGREADTRQNFYGFDMNRDWFARTQPETDGKIELLRQYPGPLFIDAHEMGRKTYFFPPNADPIYHEITDEAVSWINNDYGCAMIDEFTEQGIPFFNRDLYDLFYMGYGDTVPATGFGSAGMTFEKANGDPIATRLYEQYLTQWTSLSVAAERKTRILSEWASAWREAYVQGVNGLPRAERAGEPGQLETEVPTDLVRHYFLRADDPSKTREVQSIVRRLQRMDVEVYQLDGTLEVTDFKAYGRDRAGGHAAGGHLLDPHGPDAEALGAGDAERGHLHALPVLLRRDGLEPAAAVQRAGRLLGLELSPRGAARRRARRAGASRRAARRAPADRAVPLPTDAARARDRVLGLAALPARAALGPALPDVTRRGHRPRRARRLRRAAGAQRQRRRAARRRSAVAASAPCRTGSAPAATGSRGAAAPSSRPRVGVTTALLDSPTTDVPGSLFRVRMDERRPLRTGVGPRLRVLRVRRRDDGLEPRQRGDAVPARGQRGLLHLRLRL